MTIEMDSDIDEAMLATAEEAIARWDARAEVRKARNEALAARRPLGGGHPYTAGGSRQQSGRRCPSLVAWTKAAKQSDPQSPGRAPDARHSRGDR